MERKRKAGEDDAGGGGAPKRPSGAPLPSESGAPSLALFSSCERKLESYYAAGRLERGDLDAACLETLRGFGEPLANTVVDKLGDANLADVHNKSGFLYGIIKRHQLQSAPSDVQETQLALDGLKPSVRALVEQLCASGQVQKEQLNSNVLADLRSMDEVSAQNAVIKFQQADLSAVQNKSGFLMSILKRMRSEAAAAAPPPQGGGVGFGHMPWRAQQGYGGMIPGGGMGAQGDYLPPQSGYAQYPPMGAPQQFTPQYPPPGDEMTLEQLNTQAAAQGALAAKYARERHLLV